MLKEVAEKLVGSLEDYYESIKKKEEENNE